MNSALLLVGCKINLAHYTNFILKFYLYLTMRKSDFSLLTKYLLIMELHFYVVTKIFMGPYQMFTRAAFGLQAAGSPPLL